MIWKETKYNPEYMVSEDGTVKSSRKILKQRYKKGRGKQNYLEVSFMCEGKLRVFLVHRLVAEHFLVKPSGRLEVHHKDSDKSNNHYSNLEWITHKENMEHASRAGLLNVPHKNNEGNRNCKHVGYYVIKRKKYRSAREAAKALGVSHPTVLNRIKVGLIKRSI